MNMDKMDPSDIHLIHTVPALVAALPALFGQPIPGRSLVLLALSEMDGGWSVVRDIQLYSIKQFTAHDACRLVQAAPRDRLSVLGVLVDRDTTRHTTAHATLLDDAGYYLDLQNVGFSAVYSTTATTAGNPIWSMHTRTYHGPVPVPDPRRTAHATYLPSADLTRFIGYPDHHAA